MSRIAALAPVVVLVLAAACSPAVTSARKPTEMARQQAAGQFACHEQDVAVRELGSSRVEASGCGKTATWSCTTDGDDVVGVSDRRCRRVTDIASQRDGVQAGARSAKAESKNRDAIEDGATPASFPREDARTAIHAAEGGLRSCNDSAVPKTLDVALRFEPNGKVSTVEVSPAGSAAACVQSRLREVAVTPFEGQPVTIRLPVTL